MSNTVGNCFRITIFGQSHAPAIGVTMEGLPAGFAIDMDRLTNPKVQKGLQRICQIMKKSRIGYQVRDWNPAFKGIDDYYLATPEYDTRWKAA